MKEKFGPCIEKNCSVCCNPVKVARFFPEEKIPKDADGNNLWQKRNELLIPQNQSTEDRLEAYDCKNFNTKSGLCNDYENRPSICRNTGCIDPNSTEPNEEQFKKAQGKDFVKIKLWKE
jgi:Fe-S-cluster containining protein